MKVVTLLGGPKLKGNTATVAKMVTDEMIKLGHEVETIYLQNKQMNGCLACMKCKEDINSVSCIQKDDAATILEIMAVADLVLFTSPLYFWGVSGPLKTLIDRTFSFYIDFHKPGHASMVAGQRQALLITGGGPYENNAEAAFTAFSRLQNPHMAVNAGELFIGKCTTPDALSSETREQAVAFAKKITS